MSSTNRGWPSGRRPAEAQAAPLADRERVGPSCVPTRRRPRRRSRRCGWAPGRRASRAASRGCRRSRRSRCRGCPACPRPAARVGGLRAHRGLRRDAEREQRVPQLVLVEHAEHVGLVLAVVDRPGASRPARRRAGAQLRVVPGRHRVEAEAERPVQDGGELDLLVAAQARVGSAPGGVLVHEVVDHVLVEPFGQVPDVERDADHVGGPAGVVGVLDRAAAARARAVRRGVARQREVDAGDVVAGLGGPGGGDRGVHAAGHGGEDLHRSGSPPRRPARVRRAGTMRLDERRTSAGGRAVAEREPQRVPRLASWSQPIASSTCEGWGTPAEQAEPVEHSMPRASSSISSESPSQPGKPRWALPGQPVHAAGSSRRRARARRAPPRSPGGPGRRGARRPGRRARSAA